MLSRPALNNKIMEQKSPLLEKSLRTQSCLPRRQQPAVALAKVACHCAGSEKSFVGLKGGSQSRTHTSFVVLGARHLPYSLCQCWLEIPWHLAGGGSCKSEGLCHAAAGPAYQNQSLVLPPALWMLPGSSQVCVCSKKEGGEEQLVLFLQFCAQVFWRAYFDN